MGWGWGCKGKRGCGDVLILDCFSVGVWLVALVRRQGLFQGVELEEEVFPDSHVVQVPHRITPGIVVVPHDAVLQVRDSVHDGHSLRGDCVLY